MGYSTIIGGRQWLTVAVILYVIAIVYSIAVQAPAGRRLVDLTETPPAPGSPPPPELAGDREEASGPAGSSCRCLS